MTENELRQNIVNIAKAWLGCKESDGSHRKIIDLYNSHKPLARSYAVKYTDAWCATFVSAVAIKAGLTDIIPTECGCNPQIQLFKDLGCWVENDAYVPKIADIIFYDWEDSGMGDNKGSSDHVGIVTSIVGTTITVIEGNKNDAVGYRTIKVDGKYIRGYGCPKYSTKASKTYATCRQGDKNSTVKLMQQKLIALGYSCGSCGDDGSFGPATLVAVKKFQQNKGLEIDGICGPLTWAKLNG